MFPQMDPEAPEQLTWDVAIVTLPTVTGEGLAESPADIVPVGISLTFRFS